MPATPSFFFTTLDCAAGGWRGVASSASSACSAARCSSAQLRAPAGGSEEPKTEGEEPRLDASSSKRAAA
ncbi:hypothetical protein GUJ93_ZPchr0001g30849 [Zizania palustris]|uniref:Uncharacterized protein n=1 Tax=Zizania palustris TaxID=103762 RepID=A0A8J5V238_ZIZPA|nr:hypothetical protein GUJ93_ZPchr0001g30849 [Zizania palustris]